MSQADIAFVAQAIFGGIVIIGGTAAFLFDWQDRAERKRQDMAARLRRDERGA